MIVALIEIMADDRLRGAERRWRETDAFEDLIAYRRVQDRAGKCWGLEHTLGVGYVVFPDAQRFGPSQASLQASIRNDRSGLSALLHPRVVLPNGEIAYRMLGSDEVMKACVEDPSLLDSYKWSGASFLKSGNRIEVRPSCPFLMGVAGDDGHYVWSLDEAACVLGSQDARVGVEGVDYFVGDLSNQGYSTHSRDWRPFSSPEEVQAFEGWQYLAGGKEDASKRAVLKEFSELEFDRLRKRQKKKKVQGMACWVAENDGLRAVAFDGINNGGAVGDYIGGARLVRVAPINASEATSLAKPGKTKFPLTNP